MIFNVGQYDDQSMSFRAGSARGPVPPPMYHVARLLDDKPQFAKSARGSIKTKLRFRNKSFF